MAKKQFRKLFHTVLFALYRAEYDLFQIELSKSYGIPDWREDIKRLLMKAGVENKPSVFLFTDTQVSINYSCYYILFLSFEFSIELHTMI